MAPPEYPRSACPGNGVCCNRDEVSRTLFPCNPWQAVTRLSAEVVRLRAEVRQLREALAGKADAGWQPRGKP